MSDALQRTPLFELHKSLGARFVGFGGWEMPVQYTGVIEEHQAVRTAAGLFDVSHMGEIFVRGPGAPEYLQYLTPNDVSKLTIGKAQYSLLSMENGAAVDDIIIYRLGEMEYLLCVNAANIEKDFSWLRSHLKAGVEVENQSTEWAQIAIQGPLATTVAGEVLGFSEAECAREQFPFFTFRDQSIALNGESSRMIVARTGYTGEDGFEVFLPARRGAELMGSLLECGRERGVKPAGLGARDTLRLEAALPLYGHELSDSRNILEANLGWVVKFGKGNFLGHGALLQSKERGLREKLIGLELIDPGIAREHCKIYSGDLLVGETTSGTKTPTIGKSIALAYVMSAFAEEGSTLAVEVRDRRLQARVVKLPFYRRKG